MLEILPDFLYDLYITLHESLILLDLSQYHSVQGCLLLTAIAYSISATNNSYYYRHYYQRLLNPTDEMYIENDLFDSSKVNPAIFATATHRGIGWWISGSMNVILLLISLFSAYNTLTATKPYFFVMRSSAPSENAVQVPVNGTKTWSVAVWDPKPLGLMVLSGMSPGHVLIMMASSSGAGYVGYVAQLLGCLVLSGGCYYLCFEKFMVLVKQRQLIVAEMMKEYEFKIARQPTEDDEVRFKTFSLQEQRGADDRDLNVLRSWR